MAYFQLTHQITMNLFEFSVWNNFRYFIIFLFIPIDFHCLIWMKDDASLLYWVYLNNRFSSNMLSHFIKMFIVLDSLVFVCTFASSFASFNLISSNLIKITLFHNLHDARIFHFNRNLLLLTTKNKLNLIYFSFHAGLLFSEAWKR